MHMANIKKKHVKQLAQIEKKVLSIEGKLNWHT